MAKRKNLEDIIFSRYKKAKELCQPVFERVELNKNIYHGSLTLDDTYEWDYALVDQQTFPLIRSYIARCNPSMLKVRLEARKPEDFEKRQINQDFVNWEMGEIKTTSLLTRAFFSNFVAGKAYFKTGWKYEKRIVVKKGKIEYELRPLLNRADLQFVKFTNILVPNRNITDLEEQPYIIELMQLSIGDMIDDNETQGKEVWDKSFINKLKKAGVKSKELDFEAEFVKDSDTLDELSFRSSTIPVICMWTKDGEVFYMPIVGDRQIINKDTTNPYEHGHYPYIDMTAFPEDDEFFSMSVVDATGDTQIAATEVLNQLLTNVRSINNNMWIVGVSAETTPDYVFQQRPSGIIRVPGDPNQVVPIRPIDSSLSMLRVSQDLGAKFERTGGISSLYASGAASVKSINQTARGAQIIDANIETNVRMIFDLFGEQVLKRLGEHFLELNAQYVTEEQTFAVTGKKGVRELITIKPEQITANFDVYPMAESMVKQTPASRQASLQNLLTTISQQANALGVQIDAAPIVEALIDSYPDMENVEDIVVSVDEKGKRDVSMLERGQMPEIKIRDPHEDLITYATIHFENNQANYPEEIKQLFEEYVTRHMQYVQAQKEAAAMARPQVPQPKSPEELAAFLGTDLQQGNVPETLGVPNTPELYNLGNIVSGQPE